MYLRILFAFAGSLYLHCLQAQVNGYAKAISISGSTITVDVSNETYAQFQAGKKVVVMQMQDNVIGSTANDATFGSLGSILQAGRYIIGTIASVGRSAGVLQTVTLSAAPAFIFNTGANSTVQLITFEQLGTGNYTTTANISALAWNGSVGGVVAFHVDGTLTLQHNITANGAGFRGGAPDASTAGTCDVTTWRSVKTDRYAYKGEGIYKVTNTAYMAGKGRILNGGGGGNDHNGGGGGGSNFTGGGLSGPGYNCGGNSAGGNGGTALSANISGDRIFMGGGAGGGEGNDNLATVGGNGGGIILIHADVIITTGSCGGRVISANGGSAGNSGNDGGGGGGAGGSILIDADAFSIADGCQLTIQANGGNGGSVNHASVHGGGGGGGQGVVWFTAMIPGLNTTSQTLNGTGGCNNNSSPCNNIAGSGTGSNNSGILTDPGSALPIELLSFNARTDHDLVHLDWVTASEYNNSHFTVERSKDGDLWSAVLMLPGAGTSTHLIEYQGRDLSPLQGNSYYRLKQTDLDGGEQWSSVVVVTRSSLHAFPAVPNPASTFVKFVLTQPGGMVRVHDDLGRQVMAHSDPGMEVELDIRELPAGLYHVVVQQGEQLSQSRFVKE